jgi:oligosaccharide reducing-end xylanase
MKHSATTGVFKSAVDITGGYRLEVKIPWATLSVTPAQNNLIGLDVHVNDDDDGGTRDGKKTWFATNDNAWQNPSLLATAQLSSSTLKNGNTITSVEEAFDREINVYPNPASNFLNINLNKGYLDGIEISLFNMLTQKVKYLKAENRNDFTINVNDLPQGIYILKIESGKYSKTQKVLIKH